MHVGAGLRNGLRPDEIVEVIMHTAAYAGIPAANTGIRVAKEVLGDDGPARRNAEALLGGGALGTGTVATPIVV